MPLTEWEMMLVKEGLGVLRQDLQPRSVEFYNFLFLRAPHLRPMFRDDIAGQGMRFMATLGLIIDNLQTPEASAARYADLGRSHRALGVKASYFATMGEALIDTLRAALGNRFTADAEAAWRKAYAEFSQAVIEAGEIS